MGDDIEELDCDRPQVVQTLHGAEEKRILDRKGQNVALCQCWSDKAVDRGEH